VAKLADQFGAHRSNPTLNGVLDAAAIGDVGTGLTNDITRAGDAAQHHDIWKAHPREEYW
jgi:hypothetical protein